MIGTPNAVRIVERREAARREILAAAWDSAHEHGLAGLTLRDVAARLGMAPPSLYGYFDSKDALYSAMFAQAWQDCLATMQVVAERAPTEPRGRLLAAAETYFDYSVADLARYQLMGVSTVPGFHPDPDAYGASQRVYAFMLDQLPLTGPGDADIYTALVGGLIAQQHANDPGGDRWRRLIPRVVAMFADDLGLPTSE